MNISDSGLKLNISTNNANIRVSTPNNAEGGIVTANVQIKMAKEGQIFNGKILDITNNKVSILLDNNKTLYAQMTDALNMNIGDSLTFMIKENNGSNVLIKPYGDGNNNMKDNAIFKILDANSISATDKNYQIAEGLMNNNMPVDKASMQRIMQQTYKYPDASIDTIINLNKLGMAVNESNISQYESYMTNTHQLSNDINNFSNSIIDFNKESVTQILNQIGITNEAALEQINNYNANLLSVLSDSMDMSNIKISGIIINTEASNQALDRSNALNGEVINTDVLNADVLNADVLNTDVLNAKALNSEALNSEVMNIKDINSDGLISNAKLLANKLNIDSSTLEGLIKDLKNMGVDDKIVNALLDESETPMQLLNNIREITDNAEALQLSADKIKDLLSGDSYNKILGDAIKDKFSLNPKNMENSKELDDLYQKMYDKANKLMEAFSGNANQGAGENMSQAAKSMQQRLDFMQNLNNMFAYAQIPVKLEQNQMNSDLYVYMNKRNMKSSKEEVSALLHLDMDHLGATDVHVSLHGSNVHTRFYVEDEISAKIIDEHMSMLEKAINENGFNLTNEVITREPSLATSPNMVVKEMLGEDLEKSVKRYSFDMRM